MNVQLLLLLALAGPLCAFPHANPTDVTTDLYVGTTHTAVVFTLDTSEAPREDHTVVTGPPTTEPATAHQEVTTEVVTEAAPPSVTTDYVVETEAPVAATTAAPEPLITDSPIEETAAPVEEDTEGAAETGEEVLVEEGTQEGMSSGQVVGIVIGSLLAVVIVIAVVIAVVRRMGKYSSTKNKKPAKKDGVMVSPLRKKQAKQQEHPRFWKF